MTQDKHDAHEDTSISSLYQQINREDPPAHVDQSILELAHKEVRHDSHHHAHPVSPFSGKWPISASLAAVLVIAFGLITFIDKEVPPTFDDFRRPPVLQLDETITQAPLSKQRKEISQAEDSTKLLQNELEQSGKEESINMAELKAADSAAQPAPLARPSEETAVTSAEAPESSFAAAGKPAPLQLATPSFSRAEEKKDATLAETDSLQRRDSDSSAGALAKMKPQQAKSKSAPATITALQDKRTKEAPSEIQLESATAMSGSADVADKLSAPASIVGSLAFKTENTDADVKQNIACGSQSIPITTEEYWLYYILDEINKSAHEGDFLCLTIKHGTSMTEYHLPFMALSDQAAQQSAFANFVGNTIGSLERKKMTPEQQQHLHRSLQRITGLSFTTNAQWISWYNEHRGKLTLTLPDNILK